MKKNRLSFYLTIDIGFSHVHRTGFFKNVAPKGLLKDAFAEF